MNQNLDETPSEIVETSSYETFSDASSFKTPFQSPVRSLYDIMFDFQSANRKEFNKERRLAHWTGIRMQKIKNFEKLMLNLKKEPNNYNYKEVVDYFYDEKIDLIEFVRESIRKMIVEHHVIHRERPKFINKLVLFMIENQLYVYGIDVVKALFDIFDRIKDQQCHQDCLTLLGHIFKQNYGLARQMKNQGEIFEKLFKINIEDYTTLKLLSSLCQKFPKDEHYAFEFPHQEKKISKILEKAVESYNPITILGITFLLDTLEEEQREDIIIRQSSKINKVCKAWVKYACTQALEIILYCSRNSIKAQYEFLNKYTKRLLQLDDNKDGIKGALLLAEELKRISDNEMTPNQAIKYLKKLYYAIVILNKKGFKDETIKLRFISILRGIIIKGEDGELYLLDDLDKNLGEQLIERFYDVIYVLKQ